MVLEKIEEPNDIKKLEESELPVLAEEIREFLIQQVAEHGGHLASNLGVVELTMALHLFFRLPEDKIIWDVGHQSYTHKLLTGRKEGFDSLRQFGGMSGFPKRKESRCDSFDTGHSSTSISAGLGYAAAKELTGDSYRVISVIGDGALTGGMAYEALNNASRLKTNFIIVLNDNKMSISENVGGLSRHLSNLRTADAYQGLKNGVTNSLNKIPVYGERMVEQIRRTKSGIKQLLIPGMLFENMGITYLGPVDGHDIGGMLRVFRDASRVDGAVVVHVLTQKGKGYVPAERHPARFHGTEPFHIETGLPLKKRTRANYTDIFSTVMRKLGERDEKVTAITAAMEDGTGLKRFHNLFPERFFDVGIAEEHAVTFGAGLAAAGMKPVVAVYSSFLQRAYDQILHDVCIQDLPVTFAIDRAGLVGSDGETHQGIFDLSWLSSIPNMSIMAPKNKWELSDMVKFAVNYGHPIAIRYPRGEAWAEMKEYRAEIVRGKSEVIYEENQIALLAVGSMVKTACQVRENLKNQGYGCTLVNVRFVKPLDTELLDRLAASHRLLVTMEENVLSGGFGEHAAHYLQTERGPEHLPKILNIAIKDVYVEHGNVELLRQELGIDADSVTGRIIAQAERL
ncbi:1-deoxy-D-xylulose-5-phosphate synthase [Eubacterium sp. 14-2]|uniref:1-deoxy-D-xylulose-5-phosphate synthase n=1 Tax=Eubacterium sp. 14-2 TaxID=1235790 RepID=UPI0003360AB6|nr:1-deoxy-D-xylulose-5-phosphate synthase [Eubacterium sp. 14-2]EOT21656.1 1-deoxy-D-xylulose-5-phosphate synthase [Eubacterium sp. 14-2]